MTEIIFLAAKLIGAGLAMNGTIEAGLVLEWY